MKPRRGPYSKKIVNFGSIHCHREASSGQAVNTVFHRSIAAATNYFVLQVPEATIRGRRLFEGGVNKFIHTKLPCSSSVGAQLTALNYDYAAS